MIDTIKPLKVVFELGIKLAKEDGYHDLTEECSLLQEFLEVLDEAIENNVTHMTPINIASLALSTHIQQEHSEFIQYFNKATHDPSMVAIKDQIEAHLKDESRK